MNRRPYTPLSAISRRNMLRGSALAAAAVALPAAG
ncbi:twin-arginine translocation signal domain-containing protein, partial [Nocardia jejuensis]